MTTLHRTRVALIVSLTVNVLLVAGIWLYVHFAGLLDIIESVVGFVG